MIRRRGILLGVIILSVVAGHKAWPQDAPKNNFVLPLFSSEKDAFLQSLYPFVPRQFSPTIPNYDWESLGFPSLRTWSYDLDANGMRIYRDVAIQLEAEVSKNVSKKPKESLYLRADLLFAAAWNQKGEKGEKALEEARQAYASVIKDIPHSAHFLRAVYHLGLILLKQHQYTEGVRFVQQYEAVWSKDAGWAPLLRDLTMEFYYLRQRYIRAEDYLWSLASQINRDELTPSLSLRYGDSLFWQKRYEDAASWYEKSKPYLENPVDAAAWMSRLYYAETLFQRGEIHKAAIEFEAVHKGYAADLSTTPLDLRRIQCRLLTEEKGNKLVEELTSFQESESERPLLVIAAEIQLTRLLIRRGQSSAYPVLAVFLKEAMKGAQKKPYFYELSYLLSIIEWEMGQKEEALKFLENTFPEWTMEETASPLMKEASLFVLYVLRELVPLYWEKKDYAAFLVLCNRFSAAIDLSPENHQDILVWVARAYTEGGMTAAGAHLFQKLLEGPLPEDQKSQVLLELALTYAAMQEKDLLSQTLAVITQPPADLEKRRLYYLAKAADFVAHEKFEDCSHQFELIMKEGVRGSDLFRFSLEGAICARKAKKFDTAENFLEILDIKNRIPSNSNAQNELDAWKERAFFEKINLMVAEEKYADAIRMFEAAQGVADQAPPPLETAFLMIDAYRAEGEADKAKTLWETYKDKGLPKDFEVQFGRILELLSQAEMVPRN